MKWLILASPDADPKLVAKTAIRHTDLSEYLCVTYTGVTSSFKSDVWETITQTRDRSSLTELLTPKGGAWGLFAVMADTMRAKSRLLLGECGTLLIIATDWDQIRKMVPEQLFDDPGQTNLDSVRSSTVLLIDMVNNVVYPLKASV